MTSKIPELYDHQRKIIEEDRKQFLLALGTGSAKTRILAEMAEGETLVLSPKQQKLDRNFERAVEQFGLVVNYTTLSREQFKKIEPTITRCDTLIIDECHKFFGVETRLVYVNGIPVPKVSDTYKAVIRLIKRLQPKRMIFASATPAPNPMNLWGIGQALGKDWDYFKFRGYFYFEVKKGRRSMWLKRKENDRKEKFGKLINELGYTGRLQDWFDVPEQQYKTVRVRLTKEQEIALKHLYDTTTDQERYRAKRRQIENGILYGYTNVQINEKEVVMKKTVDHFPCEKTEVIKEYALEFPKLLIFANYTAQIKHYAEVLRHEGYKVLELTGQTSSKDRVTLMQDAEASEACIVIAQASVSEGYEFKTCECVIFASQSNKLVDKIQGEGRVLRSDALKKNLYVYLITTGEKINKKVVRSCDEACYEALINGEDYQEAQYEKKGSEVADDME